VSGLGGEKEVIGGGGKRAGTWMGGGRMGDSSGRGSPLKEKKKKLLKRYAQIGEGRWEEAHT